MVVSLFYFSNNVFLKVLSSCLIVHMLNFNLSLKQIISGSYQLFIVFILLYFLTFYLKCLLKN